MSCSACHWFWRVETAPQVTVSVPVNSGRSSGLIYQREMQIDASTDFAGFMETICRPMGLDPDRHRPQLKYKFRGRGFSVKPLCCGDQLRDVISKALDLESPSRKIVVEIINEAGISASILLEPDTNYETCRCRSQLAMLGLQARPPIAAGSNVANVDPRLVTIKALLRLCLPVWTCLLGMLGTLLPLSQWQHRRLLSTSTSEVILCLIIQHQALSHDQMLTSITPQLSLCLMQWRNNSLKNMWISC